MGRRFTLARAMVAFATALAMLMVLMPAAVYAEDPDVLLEPKEIQQDDEDAPPPSGTVDFRDVDVGNAITECPQAGSGLDKQPKPLDQREIDAAEKLSQGRDDSRTNQDYACFPQDETSIAVNPTNQKNAVAGANDYRLGWGSSGFYVTTDGGNHWYDGVKPFPTNANSLRDHIDGGGDPAVAFDRGGTAYYNDLHFMRENDESGIFVARSTNGGFTWSRPCVPAGSTDTAARCGGNGDVRRPGDGVVHYTPDNDLMLNGSVDFNDKNYMTTGPRPDGVSPVCFAPITKTPIPAGQPGCPASLIGPDRLYVTWTIFNGAGTTATINFSYSDDRAYSWSRAREIGGSAPFCAFGASTNGCDANQASVPTVNPVTGHLWVAFENFNTPDENQYLVVRSNDGGQTWLGPYFVSVVFDVNYPRSGQNRQDCTARGQGGRAVLTNSCFRVNSYGNIVADRRGGDFADDLYLVFSDNRNGQRTSSNVDVFFFTSKDGGVTWLGPTRVNNDPSRQPTIAEGTRDCDRIVGRVCPTTALAFGNDNWWPWIDISDKGDLNVVFHDRRLDTNSTVGEWPDSRAAPNGRPGNYLVWNFGAQCAITTTATVTQTSTSIPAAARQCLGDEAAIVTQPTTPPNPASGAVIAGGAQSTFPFRNFNVSDTASNWDYTFRAGIFAGDYNNVAVDHSNQAWAFWTDARNGRSARQQAGRNPICEQSDVFDDQYSASSGGSVRTSATQGMDLYLQTDCPLAMQDRGANAAP
jgi:hypothetical protein